MMSFKAHRRQIFCVLGCLAALALCLWVWLTASGACTPASAVVLFTDKNGAAYLDSDRLAQQLTDCTLYTLDAEGDAAAQLEDGRNQLQNGKNKLADGRRQYADGKTQLENGTNQMLDGQAQLNDALGQWYKADAEWQQGKQELDSGKAQLDENEPAYRDGVQQLADTLGSCPVLERKEGAQ